MQVAWDSLHQPQVKKSPSQLTCSIKETVPGSARSNSHHAPISTLLSPQRFVGNCSLLQRPAVNPIHSLCRFSCSALTAQFSPSDAELVPAPQPQSPVPVTPCLSPFILELHPHSRSQSRHHNIATGPAGSARQASCALDVAKGECLGRKQPKLHPFYTKVLPRNLGNQNTATSTWYYTARKILSKLGILKWCFWF